MDSVSPWFLIFLEVVNKGFGNKLVDIHNVRVLSMYVFDIGFGIGKWYVFG